MSHTENSNPNAATAITLIVGGETVELKGKTLESIMRRTFGRKAVFHASRDRNAPEWGNIVTRAVGGGWNIQARVVRIESTGPNGGREIRGEMEEGNA